MHDSDGLMTLKQRKTDESLKDVDDVVVEGGDEEMQSGVNLCDVHGTAALLSRPFFPLPPLNEELLLLNDGRKDVEFYRLIATTSAYVCLCALTHTHTYIHCSSQSVYEWFSFIRKSFLINDSLFNLRNGNICFCSRTFVS